jgi:hypothetical protein
MLPTTISQDFALVAVAVLSAAIAVNLYRIADREVRRAIRRGKLTIPRISNPIKALKSRCRPESRLGVAVEL